MAGKYEDQLNRSMPSAKRSAMGTALAQLIAGFNALAARASCAMLGSAGLVINGAGATFAKAGSAFSALVAGVPIVVAANTAMSAIAGNIATTKFAAWAFYVDGAGVITTSAKTADAATAAAAAALLPAPPANKTMVGFIVVQNATGGNFVGGTTALDAASITTSYYSTVGSAVFAGTTEGTALLDLESRST